MSCFPPVSFPICYLLCDLVVFVIMLFLYHFCFSNIDVFAILFQGGPELGGIYIKSFLPGGSAEANGRIAIGKQDDLFLLTCSSLRSKTLN